MNLIPVGLSRLAGDVGLRASQEAPTLLFGAGILGFVTTTVLASRATLKLDDTLKEIQSDLALAKEVHETKPAEFTEQDLQEVRVHVYGKGALAIARLYGPPILLGVASIYCLSRSHNLLMERNEGLAAAYMAVDQAFKGYRNRVIDKYGEDEDRELMFGAETREIWDEDKGKMIETKTVPPGTPSQYARFFDELCDCWERNPEYNLTFLRCQQNRINDRLHVRGHVFLNEVYDMLGLERTSAGNVVGWLASGDGDCYIDFGIWDAGNPKAVDFVNGREGAILLDFNVDGPILHMLDERGR